MPAGASRSRDPGQKPASPAGDVRGASYGTLALLVLRLWEDADVHVDPTRLRHRGSGPGGPILGRGARLSTPVATGWFRYLGCVLATPGHSEGTLERRVSGRRS